MIESTTLLEELSGAHWDMYKDAFGVRPRGVDTSKWTVSDFEHELDFLAVVIDNGNKDRIERETAAIAVFEARLVSLVDIGAKDRAMAMRWIHEAEGSNGDDEFLCYLVGLPYQYLRK